jgi:Uma2 family endonuclease
VDGPSKKNATYDDLVNLPENVVGEIVGGELFVTPRPRFRHGVTSIDMAHELHGRFRLGRGGPGGWWILAEPELHLGDDVLVPDLAGWRVERLSDPDPAAPYLSVAPDWVAEIVSPGTARLDRVHKLPVYAREDVAHAWIVDPAAHTLEVFRLEGGAWRVVDQRAGDVLARLEPFDAVELDLSRWWLPDAKR